MLILEAQRSVFPFAQVLLTDIFIISVLSPCTVITGYSYLFLASLKTGRLWFIMI